MNTQNSTIKGIFVRQHIKAIKKHKGSEGLKLLEQKFGKPLTIKNSDNVPIADEVKLLEAATIILHPKKYSQQELDYEAGKLHFINFSQSPIGRILFFSFNRNIKRILLHSNNITAHIMKGILFSAKSTGKKSILIMIGSNGYPLHHFRGFFEEWFTFSKVKGTVKATFQEPASHMYELDWK